MKNLLFILSITLFSILGLQAQADNYKAFEWDILRLGYVIPGGDGISGGLSFGTEPRFNLMDNISVGLRWELALFGAEDVGTNTAEVGIAGSFAAIGDYYFRTDGPKRAFAGMGIGRFNSGTVTVTDGNGVEEEFEGTKSIGIIPRVGFELGHFRTTIEYNFLFKEGSSNYIGVNFAGTLFGGYTGSKE